MSIRTRLRTFVDQLRFVEEDPTGPMADYGRCWRWDLAASWRAEKYPEVSLIQRLIWRQGAPTDVPCSYVYLQLRLREWGFRQYHTYYDGPHCGYVVGPIHLYKQWNWCTKCMPDR
jgi:hypothetical protein